MKKLLILSGKGGSGKTTVAAALIALSHARAYADCDVDAPNLHLVTAPAGVPAKKDYYGGDKAVVDADKCIGCGACAEHCRFDAIHMQPNGKAKTDEYACEGCGVCTLVCPAGAVTLQKDVAGKQMLCTGAEKETVFSTARLRMGRGNSGKLVTAVKTDLQKAARTPFAVLDGSPGIGCPVIASVSGVDFVLIVAEPSLSGLHDLARIVRTAETLQVPCGVCINKWDVSPDCTGKIETFCQKNDLPFLGRIPYDKAAAKAANEGRSLAGADTPAAAAIRQFYKKLLPFFEAAE